MIFDDNENWDVYESHGCQLRLVDAVPLEEFDIGDGTPIQIKSLANGTIYMVIRQQ
jgi:hypothetical protein